MFNAYQTTTLQFNPTECNGCGMCYTVCPHAVFNRNGRTITVAHAENCMECGACQLNCPTNAITVDSGVGCAAAMMYAAVTGKREPVCG
ncbi:MAG: ferredoxin family protein [Chloroflexi bacterium]|nr:ferredoxin family protein [Chloroflexota bacterium]